MEVIKSIHLDKEKKVISYFYPIKFKAPLFKRVGLRQELRVSGTKEKGKYTNENAVLFTVNIYHAKLKIDPQLVSLSYANESFPCREIINDSYVNVIEYQKKGDNSMSTSRETIPFSKLLFEIPTTKLLFYLEQDQVPLALNFPKVEFKAVLKRQTKDYVEYVARYCADKPISPKLINKIEKDEKRQNLAFLFYIIGAIALPLIAIIIIINFPDSYEIKRSISELILKCIVGWSVGYSFIHFLVVRPIVGKNTSFLFRLFSIFD